MSKKNENPQIITQVMDTDDILEKGWAKPIEPSPAPVDIAPLPPQQVVGESKPEPGGSGNPPQQQGETGHTDAKGK